MMRLGTLLFWSVAVVAALTTCSCNLPGMSRTTDASPPQPIENSNSVNPQSEPTPNPKSPEAEAYLSGDIRLNTVDRKEMIKRFGYDLDIHYPQITKPRTHNQRRFNRYVLKID
jgi:hypothetical protein